MVPFDKLYELQHFLSSNEWGNEFYLTLSIIVQDSIYRKILQMLIADTKKIFNNYQSILLYYYKKFWKIIEWTIEIIILIWE